MSAGLTVVGISGAILIVLTVLFIRELGRGERLVASSLRQRLDRFVVWVILLLNKSVVYTLTLVLHFLNHHIAHRAVTAVISLLTRLQNRLSVWRQRYRKTLRSVNHSDPRSHLGAIAAHKEETQLTEAEKRKRRSH